MLSPSWLNRADELRGGGGGRGFADAPPPIPPDGFRPVCDSKGGGAPGFALDTNGGGAPTATTPVRTLCAESRLFVTTESLAGGGGANTGAATGATAARVAAAISRRFFSRALASLPSRPPVVLGEFSAETPPSLGDLGDPSPPDGEGRSDTPSLVGVRGDELCSPHNSVVSAELAFSPVPTAALPASVPASDARDIGGGSSA